MSDLRFGNNSIDNMMYGNNHVDKIYLGDTEVWSAIPADVKAHIARVIADGGTVPEQDKMVSIVKKLMSANLWNNCVFFGLPLGGVKKDGNQFVSKVYDLKANADLLQTTGTAQPKYQSDGSLLYDGGDKIQSANLLTSNPIAQCRNAITVICWVNIITIGTQFIFDRYSTTGGQDVWYLLQTSTGVMKAQIMSTPILKIKEYETVSTIGTGWKCLTFTYSIANGMKLYINGVNQSVTKITDSANASIGLTTSPIALGQRTGNTADPYLNGNKTALSQMYNYTLSDEQILWNYNNIRPEGV